MDMAIATEHQKAGIAPLFICYVLQDLLSQSVIVWLSKLHVKISHFVLILDKYTPSSLDVYDFDSGKLAICLEG